MSKETCYMCESEGITKEHAPPKCIFPESKDLIDGAMDLRKNLIKVPSCIEHNNAKSKDDEYLLTILSMNITSSDHGVQQFLTKVQRSWARSQGLKISLLNTAKQAKIIDLKSKVNYKTFELTIDSERVRSVLKASARALYFYKFQEKFVGEIDIITFFLMDRDPKFNQQLFSLSKKTEIIFSEIAPEGENPQVFNYKFFINEEDAQKKVMLEMNFYEGSKAVAIFKG